MNQTSKLNIQSDNVLQNNNSWTTAHFPIQQILQNETVKYCLAVLENYKTKMHKISPFGPSTSKYFKTYVNSNQKIVSPVHLIMTIDRTMNTLNYERKEFDRDFQLHQIMVGIFKGDHNFDTKIFEEILRLGGVTIEEFLTYLENIIAKKLKRPKACRQIQQSFKPFEAPHPDLLSEVAEKADPYGLKEQARKAQGKANFEEFQLAFKAYYEQLDRLG